MTFEEILKIVGESDSFEHLATTYGPFFLAESYSNKKIALSLLMKHSAKGCESYEKDLLVVVGGVDLEENQYVHVTADQFFRLREAINLNCNPWSENKR